MLHGIVEASSIIYDLCRQYFADTKYFKLERLGHLIKFIWIIVLASQVPQEMFVLGLESHQS